MGSKCWGAPTCTSQTLGHSIAVVFRQNAGEGFFKVNVLLGLASPWKGNDRHPGVEAGSLAMKMCVCALARSPLGPIW